MKKIMVPSSKKGKVIRLSECLSNDENDRRLDRLCDAHINRKRSMAEELFREDSFITPAPNEEERNFAESSATEIANWISQARNLAERDD